MTVVCRGVSETRALGKRLGRRLRPSDLVCLYGNLGAGKTVLAEAVARGAGYQGDVMSPSFGLVRLYRAKTLRIYHIDLYRVSNLEIREIGLEYCFSDPGAACVVEWPEAANADLPRDRLEIKIKHVANGRSLSFRALGPRSRRLFGPLALGGA